MIKKWGQLVLLGLMGWGVVGEVSVKAAGLYFTPDRLHLTIDQTERIEIRVEPEHRQILGVDMVIEYDPEIISIEGVEKAEGFERLTGEKRSGLGKLEVSVSNDFQQFTTKDSGVIYLKVKAKQAGETQLKWRWENGATTETNVVAEGGVDVLEEVGGVNIQVGTVLGEVKSEERVLGEQSEMSGEVWPETKGLNGPVRLGEEEQKGLGWWWVGVGGVGMGIIGWITKRRVGLR